MDGSLTVKPHLGWSLVTEPSVYTMRSCGLLFSWMRSLISDSVLPLAILRSAFPSFLAGVSHRDAGIGFGTFPIPLVCLSSVSWHTCSFESSAWPIQNLPCPSLHPLVSSWLCGVGCGDVWQHWSILWPAPLSVWFALNNNNNNEYLERLTCTGPKRLHVHYKYIVKIQCIQHECTHARTHADVRMHARAHTHTHTPVAYQGNETEEKVFKMRISLLNLIKHGRFIVFGKDWMFLGDSNVTL